MSTSEDISAHMHRVQLAGRDLRELGMAWRTIESAAAISCPEDVAPILPTLIATRERFEQLQDRLVEQMAQESREALGDELSAKAQCAIDILVRNLYERTADVGFLATDDSVRAYCSASPAEREAGHAAMLTRLREYQAKYSVYDDLILLAPDGQVLARLAETAGPTHSREPLLERAMASTGWTERFGPSDLAEAGQPALMYAHRIEGTDRHLAGVLVLRFRFANEMSHIFEGVADARLGLAIMLIDADRRVIATNDEAHVPLGTRLAPVEVGDVQLTTFAGREYLAVCCASHGYQGYAGPGWRAQAMVSLLTAFRRQAGPADQQTTVPLDHPALLAINRDADDINRDLRRVVWNGRLMAGVHQGDQLRLKAVLTQVNQASVRTRRRVAQAIQELAQTSLDRARHQSADLARLAADIMDRNLYERANDCRWWALSPALLRGLAEAATGVAAAQTRLCTVLDHVNSLYTVYSRLVVFDAQGRIQGASNAQDRADLLGQPVAPGWLTAVSGLQGSQQYAVSDFEDTPLHEGGPTYTYLAALRHPQTHQLLGGIAIIFHAARELASMLQDVLGDRAGFAMFIDAAGRPLASTHPELSAGAPVGRGECHGMFEHLGSHYVYASVAASGYREFKTADGYANGVQALVALRLGTTERRQMAYSDMPLTMAVRHRHATREVAVFQVGAGRYAFAAEQVLQAAPKDGVVPVPDPNGPIVGMIEVHHNRGSELVPVMCARRLFNVPYPARSSDGVVLVLRHPQASDRPALGLRVDDVLTVLEFDADAAHAAPTGFRGFAPWVQGILECQTQTVAHPTEGVRPETVLLQWLDADWLLARGMRSIDTSAGSLVAGPAAASRHEAERTLA